MSTHIIYEMDLLEDFIFDNESPFNLILAAGSDYRAYEVIRKQNGLINKIIVFNFSERIPEGSDLYDTYFDFIKFTNQTIIQIDCSIRDPKSCLDQLIQNKQLFRNNPIAIDISCFTKPYFFYLLKFFKERIGIRYIPVFYTEPISYRFPTRLFNSFQSTSGPLDVLEIPGFSGYEKRGDKRILIILLGFDGDLSREIKEDISPIETILVNGFPGYSPKFKDISLIANEKLASEGYFRIEYSKANNPFEVYNLLEKILKKNPNTFINIAPLGTKPMALGACLFALSHIEARVVYPLPHHYKNITTDDCWKTWRFGIPLD